jgi:hypothetical protein
VQLTVGLKSHYRLIHSVAAYLSRNCLHFIGFCGASVIYVQNMESIRNKGKKTLLDIFFRNIGHCSPQYYFHHSDHLQRIYSICLFTNWNSNISKFVKWYPIGIWIWRKRETNWNDSQLICKCSKWESVGCEFDKMVTQLDLKYMNK